MTLQRDSKGNLIKYAWPGGYQVNYLMADGGTLCPHCANGENGSEAYEQGTLSEPDEQWEIIGTFINWENEGPIMCDHCNEEMKPEYGED
jgi:hypothetical protein